MKARFETSKHNLIFTDINNEIDLLPNWYPEFFMGQVAVINGVMELITRVAVGENDQIAMYCGEHTIIYTPATGKATLVSNISEG